MEAIDKIREALPPFANDIQLNLSSVLQGGSLDDRLRWGVAAACAMASGHGRLRDAVVESSKTFLSEDDLDDAKAAVALMAMNNVYYRFRHMVGRDVYETKPARLRMNRIVRPRTNKTTFELFCLVVSAINGCETCIQSHERAVLEGGLNEDQVNDAIRIAATMRAAAVALDLP